MVLETHTCVCNLFCDADVAGLSSAGLPHIARLSTCKWTRTERPELMQWVGHFCTPWRPKLARALHWGHSNAMQRSCLLLSSVFCSTMKSDVLFPWVGCQGVLATSLLPGTQCLQEHCVRETHLQNKKVAKNTPAFSVPL